MSADGPSEIVRITGSDDELYALDSFGHVWMNWQPRHQYKHEWTRLPSDRVRDLYVHADLRDDERRQDLRILTYDNKVFQLRWFTTEAEGTTFTWDVVPL